DQSMVYTGRGVSATKVASAKLALLPLPAFIIRIANRTDAPISFGRAQLALEDDRGHRYRAYSDSGEVIGRIEANLQGEHPQAAQDNGLVELIKGAIGSMPLLTKATTIPARSEWQGYLVFKLEPRDLAELDDFVAKLSSMKVKIDADGLALEAHVE